MAKKSKNPHEPGKMIGGNRGTYPDESVVGRYPGDLLSPAPHRPRSVRWAAPRSTQMGVSALEPCSDPAHGVLDELGEEASPLDAASSLSAAVAVVVVVDAPPTTPNAPPPSPS